MTCADCKHRQSNPPSIRRTAEKWRRRGDPERAVSWLLVHGCCVASACGRLCPHLIKGPGVSQVKCLDPETGELAHLYEALADPEWRCPQGLF